jgi:hypothetical protein
LLIIFKNCLVFIAVLEFTLNVKGKEKEPFKQLAVRRIILK